MRDLFETPSLNTAQPANLNGHTDGSGLMTVEFRLLGTVEAQVDGEVVELGPPRQRAVLAILLVEANRSVPIGQLEARLWEVPPQRARKTLHSYISRLRSILADRPGIEIGRQSGGYIVKTDARNVDLHRFRDLLDRARDADGPVRLRLLDQALRISTGEAFDGLDLPWLNTIRTDIDAERLAATLDRNDALLDAGEHARLCTELATHHDPASLDERLARQYMLALWRSGRQADALAEFRRLRTALVERLGSEPSESLADLHRDILNGDAGGQAKAEQTDRPVPRQLPAAPRGFAGREEELSQLDSAIGGIGIVAGAGGVGKTWLVNHWAHRWMDRFPDGQLCLNLRGFDVDNTPVPAAIALQQLLDAFGVPHESIPTSVDARSSLFRSVVADKRLLLVLDNARDLAQIEPLLPGSAGATTIVISRHQLTDLIVTRGATPVTSGAMTDADAAAVLTTRLGQRRVKAEPDATAELVRYCGGLPLALGVIAARAATRPSARIADLVAELADRKSRLDALSAGQLSVGIRVTLEASVQVLETAARDVFRLMGTAPAGGLTIEALASLAGMSASSTRWYLDDLEDAHLVERDREGVYRMHDLVHLYAAELAADDKDATVEPLRRLVDHFGLGCMVKLRLGAVGGREWIQPTPDVLAPDIEGREVFGWLAQQYDNLLALLPTAAEHGWYPQLWVLSRVLYQFQEWIGDAEDMNISLEYAHRAAEHLDDPMADCQLNRTIGEHRYRMGDADGALTYLRRAADQAEAIGDRIVRMSVVQALAWVYTNEGRGGDAVAAATELLSLVRAADPVQVTSSSHHLLGWCLAQAGEYTVARAHCEHALRLFGPDQVVREAGDIHDTLGHIADSEGHVDEALTAYGLAIAAFDASGAVVDKAKALTARAATHRRAGDLQAARRDWTIASGLLRNRMLTDQAAQVERELAALG